MGQYHDDDGQSSKQIYVSISRMHVKNYTDIFAKCCCIFGGDYLLLLGFKNMSNIDISSNQFQTDVLDVSGIVVVDFYAVWCGPCKVMSPVIEDLSETYKNAKFVKIDVDQNQDIAEKYNIFSIPTLVFFKDGKPVHQESGALPRESIVAACEKL